MTLIKERRIFVSLGFTDMRKQINGLSVIVQQSCTDGPFTGSYCIFYGRTGKILKIPYWDKYGIFSLAETIGTRLISPTEK
jgi:transposase